jgi:uncharacterized C2H2 Zn-finger protein
MSKEKYWETVRKEWFNKTFLVIVFITTLNIFSIFLFSKYWYILILIILVELVLIIIWQAKNSIYCCPRCGRIFEISALEYFLCPSGINAKYLKCPECGKTAWTEILRIKEYAVNKESTENKERPEN